MLRRTFLPDGPACPAGALTIEADYVRDCLMANPTCPEFGDPTTNMTAGEFAQSDSTKIFQPRHRITDLGWNSCLFSSVTPFTYFLCLTRSLPESLPFLLRRIRFGNTGPAKNVRDHRIAFVAGPPV